MPGQIGQKKKKKKKAGQDLLCVSTCGSHAPTSEREPARLVCGELYKKGGGISFDYCF